MYWSLRRSDTGERPRCCTAGTSSASSVQAGFPVDHMERRQEPAGIRAEPRFAIYVQHAVRESTHDLIYQRERFSERELRLHSCLSRLPEIVDGVLESRPDGRRSLESLSIQFEGRSAMNAESYDGTPRMYIASLAPRCGSCTPVQRSVVAGSERMPTRVLSTTWRL
jgi:hypothetical protein